MKLKLVVVVAIASLIGGAGAAHAATDIRTCASVANWSFGHPVSPVLDAGGTWATSAVLGACNDAIISTTPITATSPLNLNSPGPGGSSGTFVGNCGVIVIDSINGVATGLGVVIGSAVAVLAFTDPTAGTGGTVGVLVPGLICVTGSTQGVNVAASVR